MLKLTESYNKAVQEEMKSTADQLKTRYVGKQDPKRHLEDLVDKCMSDSLVQSFTVVADSMAF